MLVAADALSAELKLSLYADDLSDECFSCSGHSIDREAWLIIFDVYTERVIFTLQVYSDNVPQPPSLVYTTGSDFAKSGRSNFVHGLVG